MVNAPPLLLAPFLTIAILFNSVCSGSRLGGKGTSGSMLVFYWAVDGTVIAYVDKENDPCILS